MPQTIRFCCFYGLDLDPFETLSTFMTAEEVMVRAHILSVDLDEARDDFDS